MRAALDLLRRERDFRRVYLGSLISLAGDWFALVPLVTLLATLTGGGLLGGLVLAVDTLAFALVSPYGGVLADRLDRRVLMVGADLFSAAVTLLLLAVHSEGTAWIALPAVAGIAFAKGIFTPASTAALPNLVDPPDLQTANVLNGAAWGSMLAVGAAAGGLLAALTSPRVCFAVDAVSFIVSALLTGLTRRSMQVGRPRGRPSLWADLAEAAAYARREPRVRTLLFAKTGPALGNGSLTLFPLYATQIFGVGAVGTGLMYAARGLGALAWPLAFGRRLRTPARLAGTLAGAMVLFGATYVGVAVAPFFPLLLVLLVVAHMGGGANWTLSTYALQLVVPDEVRGRIFSADVTFATRHRGQPGACRCPVGARAASGADRRLRSGDPDLRRRLVDSGPADRGGDVGRAGSCAAEGGGSRGGLTARATGREHPMWAGCCSDRWSTSILDREQFAFPGLEHTLATSRRRQASTTAPPFLSAQSPSLSRAALRSGVGSVSRNPGKSTGRPPCTVPRGFPPAVGGRSARRGSPVVQTPAVRRPGVTVDAGKDLH